MVTSVLLTSVSPPPALRRGGGHVAVAVSRAAGETRGRDRAIAVRIAPDHLPMVWPDLWPMLSPAASRTTVRGRARRDEPGTAGSATADSVFATIAAGDAQLWAVIDGARPIAAAVTQITLGPPKRCRLWLVGARCDAARPAGTPCGWAVDLFTALESFARSFGCVALWGSGRIGWHRIARKFGGRSIGIVAGLPSWERRI